jgi:hypothetical protein
VAPNLAAGGREVISVPARAPDEKPEARKSAAIFPLRDAWCVVVDREVMAMVQLAPALRTPSAAPAELERLGDEIAQLAAHIHAATWQLLVRLAEFDRREGWGQRVPELRTLAELAHGHCTGRRA